MGERLAQISVPGGNRTFRRDQTLLVDWDWRNCDDSTKCRSLSRRGESCPARGEPARAGSEPCDGLGNGIGEAEARERMGRGVVASKTIAFRMPSVLNFVKAMTVSP